MPPKHTEDWENVMTHEKKLLPTPLKLTIPCFRRGYSQIIDNKHSAMDSKRQHFLHNQEGILLVVVVLTFMKNVQWLVSTHIFSAGFGRVMWGEE